MQQLDLSTDHESFDRLLSQVAPTLGADPICSSSRWLAPAAAAFARQARHHVLVGEQGMTALLEHDNPHGPVLTSFDAVWGFATPLVGAEPRALVAETFAHLRAALPFYAVAISGVTPGSALHEALDELRPVGMTATAERCVAALDGDFAQWLGRRSSRFRRSLRAAVNRGNAAGVTVEVLQLGDPPATTRALDRILAIERRSWKTDAGSGLVDTDLGYFTRAMARRFASSGDLRVTFARLGGRDIGYVIGGVLEDRYRGFQHSFDQDHADLSIGKLLQFHTIAALASESIATYDMGMHMPYKESYTDRIEASVTLIFANR